MPNSYIPLVSWLSVASHSKGPKRTSGHLHNAVLRKLKLGTAFGFKSAEQPTGAMGGARRQPAQSATIHNFARCLPTYMATLQGSYL